MAKLRCPHCRSRLRKCEVKRGDFAHVAQEMLIGVGVIVGVALCFTGVGAFVGVPIILAMSLWSTRLAGAARVWACPRCELAMPRKRWQALDAGRPKPSRVKKCRPVVPDHALAPHRPS